MREVRYLILSTLTGPAPVKKIKIKILTAQSECLAAGQTAAQKEHWTGPDRTGAISLERNLSVLLALL